jgi:mannose-6-phosphate isomerase-like protein (cupin superfamily)
MRVISSLPHPVAATIAAAVVFAVSLVLLPGHARAQAPPAVKLFSSAGDVTALIARARQERKPDQANFVQPIVSDRPYTLNLEYRVAGLNAPASVHEKDAELFMVVDGAGTLVTGGTLKEERRTNGENLQGSGIDGGSSRKLAKGDVVLVPQNTPHWFTAIDGTLVLMSLHLPH